MLEMLEMLEMLRSSDGAVLFRDCPVVPWSKLARRSPAASPASRGMVHNALPSRGGRGRSVSLQNTVFIAVAQAGTHNATKPGITGELCGLGTPRGKHLDGTPDFSLGAAVRPERPLLSADPYLHLPTGSFGVPGASKRAAAPAACPAAAPPAGVAIRTLGIARRVHLPGVRGAAFCCEQPGGTAYIDTWRTPHLGTCSRGWSDGPARRWWVVGQGGRTGEGDLGGGVVRQDVIRVQVPGGQTRAALCAGCQ